MVPSQSLSPSKSPGHGAALDSQQSAPNEAWMTSQLRSTVGMNIQAEHKVAVAGRVSHKNPRSLDVAGYG